MLIGTITPETPIQPNPEEVHAYRWFTLPALHEALHEHPEQFTPWFKQALALACETGSK